MIGDLLAYSLRNLWTRKLRTSLTLIGIVIGVMSIVALVGLGNGLRDAIVGQFSLAGPDIVGVTARGNVQGPPGQGVVNPLKKEYVAKIDQLSSVDTAVGVLIKTTAMEFNDIQEIQLIQTAPSDSRKLRDQLSISSLRVEQGRFINAGERNKIVLGNNFASDTNPYSKAIQTGDRVLLNGNSFEVVGILKKRGSFIVDWSIRMDEDQARELFGDDDTYNLIQVRARSVDAVPDARVDIERLLRRERNVKEGKEDFSVQTPESALANLNAILSGVQIFILLVAAISIIVGAIGIVNTMFTAVVERTKEIGIMKAIGAKDEDIFLLFFIESGLLGLFGGLLGTLLGAGVAIAGTNAIATLLGTTANPNISLMLVLGVLSGSFLIGSISGIVPAVKASHLKPVDALRGA